jgi:hypothetical protein
MDCRQRDTNQPAGYSSDGHIHARMNGQEATWSQRVIFPCVLILTQHDNREYIAPHSAGAAEAFETSVERSQCLCRHEQGA